MSWHVITRVGPEDDYSPELDSSEPRLITAIDRPGATFSVPNHIQRDFRPILYRKPSPKVLDLLRLSMSVYSADHCIRRETADDGWTRDIVLHLPVHHIRLWKRARTRLTSVLNFLSGDRWTIELRKHDYSPSFPKLQKGRQRPDRVTLFSGGLDSLIGAIDLLERGHRVVLVGHYGAGMTHQFQHDLATKLEKAYPDSVKAVLTYVDPPHIQNAEREITKRTRSLLFLMLGLTAADCVGSEVPVDVAENGLITLNVPMTDSRNGSLSTRTTHPHFVEELKELLAALNLKHPIDFPYRTQTKGEMLTNCSNRRLIRKLSKRSMSCAHPEAARWAGASPGTHCGHCVPCLIRRASMYAAGFDDADYTCDVITNPSDHATKSGRDFRAMQIAANRFAQTERDRDAFDILNSGPIPFTELEDYVAVYRNGMKELRQFLEQSRKPKSKRSRRKR